MSDLLSLTEDPLGMCSEDLSTYRTTLPVVLCPLKISLPVAVDPEEVDGDTAAGSPAKTPLSPPSSRSASRSNLNKQEREEETAEENIGGEESEEQNKTQYRMELFPVKVSPHPRSSCSLFYPLLSSLSSLLSPTCDDAFVMRIRILNPCRSFKRSMWTLPQR